MENSVIFVPSRTRPSRFGKTVEQLLKVSRYSEIIACIDEDEYAHYPVFSNIVYEICPKPDTPGVNEKLNRVAYKYKADFDYMLWVADDVHVYTYDWDKKLIDAIKGVPMGISYPEDSIQGENLPSNGTCFDTKIVRALGYLAPPELLHLYIDNFWKLLGENLKTLRYCPDIKLTHNHAVVDGTLIDKQYQDLNSPSSYLRDKNAFDLYVKNRFSSDLHILRSVIKK
jgi:hypothetical protein